MPQTGYCTDLTCSKELTELYECHCCSWLVCLKHLLEHIEIAQRDKKQKLDGLKNELETALSSLEMIVEKKVREIEQEKQLIDQAKTIFNKTDNSPEEIQILSNEINQAIVANQKGKTFFVQRNEFSSLFQKKLLSKLNQYYLIPKLVFVINRS